MIKSEKLFALIIGYKLEEIKRLIDSVEKDEEELAGKDLTARKITVSNFYTFSKKRAMVNLEFTAHVHMIYMISKID